MIEECCTLCSYLSTPHPKLQSLHKVTVTFCLYHCLTGYLDNGGNIYHISTTLFQVSQAARWGIDNTPYFRWEPRCGSWGTSSTLGAGSEFPWWHIMMGKGWQKPGTVIITIIIGFLTSLFNIFNFYVDYWTDFHEYIELESRNQSVIRIQYNYSDESTQMTLDEMPGWNWGETRR